MRDATKEFRDAVHGFVKLTDAERRMVDCPTYQRLRDIRQLAMGHMVYPGAVHTRFEHSLGCLHLASTVLDLLWSDKEQRKLLESEFHVNEAAFDRGQRMLRIAALLHDLGHPPFSHSGEVLIGKDADGKSIKHEEMTARLIRGSEIGKVIEEEYSAAYGITVEHVISMATSPKHAKGVRQNSWEDFLREVLTGELGVDRMDYLLRDAHHSGQPTGRFDYQKLVHAIRLVKVPDEAHGAGDLRLGLDEGGWLVAEQMVVARYLMYVSLYFHKTKRIYELHLTDYVQEWLKATTGQSTWPTDPANYAVLTDAQVLGELIVSSRDPKAPGHVHARPFSDRSHHRLAKEVLLADNFREVDGRRVPDLGRFDKLWEHVRVMFGDSLKRDSADHGATDIFEPDTKILVSVDGRTRYLAELSEIVRGMSTRIWRGRIYCPPDPTLRAKVSEAAEAFLKQDAVPAKGDG